MENRYDPLELLKALIARRSITPDDAGCQSLIESWLLPLGFTIEHFEFEGVRNMLARRERAGSRFLFLGHTDVVPPGPEALWETPPFTPTEKNQRLIGRGATDMKSGIAAMIAAVARHLNRQDPKGTIAFLLTSDEEGPAEYGVAKVAAILRERHWIPEYCLVGEATSQDVLGDTLKVGRRGSLHGKVTILGKQGHIAYPDRVENPMHRCFKAFAELSDRVWDKATELFPSTSFQFYHMNAGVGQATNVVPGELVAKFNFRHPPHTPAHVLQRHVQQILDQHGLRYQLEWTIGSEPFYCPPGRLVDACRHAVQQELGVASQLSTSGGTSDGRFIAPLGAEVVELGPLNAGAHQVNESIGLEELAQLSRVYESILEKIFE